MPRLHFGGLLISAAMIALLSLTTNSCAGGRYLSTEEVKAIDESGTYTVILYGGLYPENKVRVAILGKEGNGYSFEIFSPEYGHTDAHGVSGREALEQAERFVSSHRSFEGYRLSRIIDQGGNTLGYELRPLYAKSPGGFSDILAVHYTIGDRKVIIKIGLRPELDRSFFEDRSLGL